MNFKILIVIGFLFLAESAKSQNSHFVFIQTDDAQTFYVKTEKGLYSSTSLGSVIIPNLEEGTINLLIGFPQNKWKSIKYQLEVKSKDLAFVLKKSSFNQWSLYDYYTLSLIQPLDTSTSNNYPSTPDNFSLILAKVSNVNLDFSDLNFGKESQLQISSIASSIQKEEKLKTENSSSGQLEHNKDSIKKSEFNLAAIDSSSEVLNSPANDSFSIASKKKDTLESVAKPDTTEFKSQVKIVSDSSVIKEVLKKSDSLVSIAMIDSVQSSKKTLLTPVVKDSLEVTGIKANDSTIIAKIKTDNIITAKEIVSLVDTSSIVISEKKKDSIIQTTKLDTVSKEMKFALKTDSSVLKSNSLTSEKKADTKVAERQAILISDTIVDGRIKDTILLNDGVAKAEKITVSQNDSLAPTNTKEVVIETKKEQEKKGLTFIEDVSIQQTTPNLTTSDSIQKLNQIDSTTLKNKDNIEETLSTKNNCPTIADEDDCWQLRKQMADVDKDDTMLSIAISAFNQKCYSVNQISNLSVLFKSDLSKCNFFESAYSHVIDKNQFESLQKLLSDDKAIGRFKQIMKNQ